MQALHEVLELKLPLLTASGLTIDAICVDVSESLHSLLLIATKKTGEREELKRQETDYNLQGFRSENFNLEFQTDNKFFILVQHAGLVCGSSVNKMINFIYELFSSFLCDQKKVQQIGSSRKSNIQ